MTLERDPALVSGDPFLLFKNARQFDIAIDGRPVDVYRFHLEEDLFSLFRAEIILTPDRRLAKEDLLGKRVTGTINGRRSARHYRGMITEYQELPDRGRYRLYRVVVESELFALTRNRNIRIFQHKTVPDIIREVLEGCRIFSGNYAFELAESYAPREYCVQFRETDMAFILRLMAEEGMFIYHRFTQDAMRVILSDTHHFHDPIGGLTRTVPLSAKGQLVNFEDHITSFDTVRRVVTEQVRLTDYRATGYPMTPDIHAQAEKNPLFYEIYDYPGYLDDDKTARRLIQVSLQRETCRNAEFFGEGVCRQLAPGHVFTLCHHPHRDLNGDYIVTRVVHDGTQPQVLRELEESRDGTRYGNTFTCIPASVTYRPQLLPKPSVRGLQSAVVVGPENEEIHVDEYGRIKIRFHWDLQGREELSSCWVRVSQIWAGGGKGCESIFTPRIGQEVLVDFLDGDPDRPVVVGTVFNLNKLPPYNLPAHKTRSTIKTRTVKGEGFNELRFDDLKGEEEIYIHGQKDWNIDILNDKNQTIGHDERLDVKNDRTKTIGHDQREEVKNDKTIAVGKNHSENVGETMNVKIGKHLDETIGENKTVAVGKNLDETVSDDAKIIIGKNRTLSIGENSVIDTGKDLTETVGNRHKFDIGDESTISVGKNLSVMVGKKTVFSSEDQISITCGSSSIIIKSDGKIQIKGMDITIDAAGKLVTKGQKISGN